MHFNSVIFAT